MDYTQYFKYFQEKTRLQSGTKFMCLTDDAPQELKDLVRAIHFDYFDGCLPNDWIYSVISEAFDDLKHDDLRGVNIEADIYNCDLIKWLENPFAVGIVDECIQEDGGCIGIIDRIQAAQYRAKSMIYQAVIDWIEEQTNTEE